MSKYVVVSDHSGKNDQECIDKVCATLTSAGHEATPGGVNANSESRLRQEGSDTIGIFIVNGACLATMISLDEMVKGGNCSHVYVGMPKPIMSDPFNKHEEWTNQSRKLHILNESWIPSDWHSKYSNKWTLQEASDNLQNITCVYGDTCEDVANNIMNGATGSGSSTSQQGEGSIMSGWESITDLLKPLDGEAMVVVRGDAVVVKRIYPPEATQLWVYEGINVVSDSVKVSDYTPEIYNTFLVKWGASFENEFELSFNKHKELFGERRTEVNAVYEVPNDDSEPRVYEKDKDKISEEDINDHSSDEGSDDGIFGFIANWLTGGTYDVVKSTANVVYDSEGNAYGGGTGVDSTDGDKPETTEIPITDEGEAYLFGLKQVGKACRKSGHQIECKVIGNKRFEVGEWCRVYLPTFREDCIMFISKVSNESSADGEWLTSLTLVDYPPSLGTGQSNTPSGDATADVMSNTDNEFVGDPSNPDATVDDAEAGDVNTNTGDL